MGRYLLRRLLIAIPSLIGISIVLFTVLALAPGDPFSELATSPDVPPEVRAALRVKFGLDDPIPIRIYAGSPPCCTASGASPSSAESTSIP
jgi:peptide/nickel transport system permease protein